jgi:uncharacterized membrane protein
MLSFVFTLRWCFVEAVLLSTWGSTPGKALLRISLSTSDGSTLGYITSLSRSLDVWIRGLAAGVPFVNLLTQLRAYNNLTKKGITSWDAARNLKVTHERIGPVRILILCTVLLIDFIAYAVLRER